MITRSLCMLILYVLYVDFSVRAHEDRVPAASSFAESLPEFTLRAPDDVEHTRKDFIGKGVVMICTAPTVAHGEDQREWVERLKKGGWNKDGPALVLLEDMTQSWFKGKAIERMKEEYKPGEAPLLLLDHKAELRKALEGRRKNALLDKTVVLVFNCEGELVYIETKAPEKADMEKLCDAIQRLCVSPLDQLPPLQK